VTVGEDEATIEDIYEPFLIQSGFITKTPSGRLIMEKGYAHLGLTPPAAGDAQQSLF
jgi:Holliday junction DNA helicase RuvB